MKRLLFAALFSLISYTSMAVASITITNNTNCDVDILLFNFSASCTNLPPASLPYTAVTVPANGGTAMIPVSAPASFPYYVGAISRFSICGAPAFSTFGSACFANSVNMANCTGASGFTCNNAVVTWTSATTVDIN